MRQFSEEHKRHISESKIGIPSPRKGKKGKPSPFKGKKRNYSEETKLKMRESAYKRCKSRDRYRRISVKPGMVILEHRYVWEKAYGGIPRDWIIHHLNGNRRDNRIENLCATPRKYHSSKTIINQYKKRIKDLETEIKILKSQGNLFE